MRVRPYIKAGIRFKRRLYVSQPIPVEMGVADEDPVARLSGNPYIIVGKNALPKTLPELVAWLKANPDKATEGTGGVGSGQHVGGVYFQKVTGTSFQFVPYRAGSSDVMRDVVAGHIDLASRISQNDLHWHARLTPRETR